ncbi:MAG: glycoside hydrolase family 43 protein [Acidobacteriaceae bacterium]|nr:glycoside hydrolase family 43 protein [Acidobacteriaceae bacterium]
MRAGTLLLALVLVIPSHARDERNQQRSTFTNPLLPSGADPSVVYRDHFYYYMQTTGRDLTIWKTRDITDLANAEKKVVWTPPPSGPYSHEIWAPELHFLSGKWYIYFAADSGKNETHRIWVIENPSPDPLEGVWTMKGKLADVSDKWAIDPTVFQDGGRLYAVWSGWQDDVNGTQNIYIARMKNPWTIEGGRVLLSAPNYAWEKFGDLPNQPVRHVDVNEGPEILKHDEKIFLIYSASGCWTDHYSLGMLVASANSDLINPASWKKAPQPVFSESAAAHAFGTGHNTFFESPDKKQYWIIYHANPEAGEGCGSYRSPRAQPFTWNADGTPNFGKPVGLGVRLPKPSGQRPN